jgi:hypothetical protein
VLLCATPERKTHRPRERIESLPLAVGANRERAFVVGPLARAFDFHLALRFRFAFGAHLEQRAKTLTGRTPAMRGVERKEARLQFIEGTARTGAKELRAVDRFAPACIERVERTAPQAERGVDQLSAIRRGLLFTEAAELDADRVLDIAIQRLELRGLDPLAIHAQ